MNYCQLTLAPGFTAGFAQGPGRTWPGSAERTATAVPVPLWCHFPEPCLRSLSQFPGPARGREPGLTPGSEAPAPWAASGFTPLPNQQTGSDTLVLGREELETNLTLPQASEVKALQGDRPGTLPSSRSLFTSYPWTHPPHRPTPLSGCSPGLHYRPQSLTPTSLSNSHQHVPRTQLHTQAPGQVTPHPTLGCILVSMRRWPQPGAQGSRVPSVQPSANLASSAGSSLRPCSGRVLWVGIWRGAVGAPVGYDVRGSDL